MRYRLAVLAVSVLALSLAGPAYAFIFVDIPGIPGDVTVVPYQGEITALALGFSGGQVVPKSGPKVCAAPSSKTQISAISLEKMADIASPKLFLAAARGTIFPDVIITIAQLKGESGVEPVAEYRLKSAFVSGFEVGSSGDRPSETVTLMFKSLALTHFSAEGPPETATWDFCGVTR